jgi:hypothetical protein
VLASAATLAVTALALLIALRLHSAVSGRAPPGCVGGGLAADWTTMDGPQVVTAPQRAGFHDATDYAVAPGAWHRPFA